MLEGTLLLLGVCALIAIGDWRKGLALCVVTGLLQDPLRKVVDGQPVYFVVLVGIVFVAALTGAYLARVKLSPRHIAGWNEHLSLPVALYIVLVLAQAVHSLARFGSPVMTGIGLLVWLAPVVALGFAYRVAAHRGLEWIRHWMTLYCILALVFLSGVYLEYAGYEWAVLGEVGEGLKIHDMGTVLKAHAGFFRSSEVAAWHTATAACFVFLLLVGKRITATRFIIAVAAVGLLMGLGILTGRRKMLVEVGIFVTAYFGLVIWYQRNQGRKALALAVAGIVALAAVLEVMGPDESELYRASRFYGIGQEGQYQIYALRGQSVIEDIPARFLNLGLAPVMWAVDSLGWFGSGLGTGSQGTSKYVDEARNMGAAEGGLGKVAVELGIPGLLVVFWLGVKFVTFLHRLLRATARASLPHLQMACGFVAILVAKTSSFAVAAQAYSDMFILLMLGFLTGFVLAMPLLAHRNVALKSQGVRGSPLASLGGTRVA